MNAPKLVFHGTPVKPKATDLLFCCGYIIPALLDFRKKLDEDMEAFWFGLPTAAQFMIYFIVTSRYACPNLWERAVKQQSTIPLFNVLYCTRIYINVLLLVLNYN